MHPQPARPPVPTWACLCVQGRARLGMDEQECIYLWASEVRLPMPGHVECMLEFTDVCARLQMRVCVYKHGMAHVCLWVCATQDCLCASVCSHVFETRASDSESMCLFAWVCT